MKGLKRGNNKKGLSPVIATVMLIAIVVAVALIIFAWYRGTIKDSITKFDQDISLVCKDVQLTAQYSLTADFPVSISNDGTVPISDVKIKEIWSGGNDLIELDNFKGLGQGGSGEYKISNLNPDATKIIVIPVLRGNSKTGETDYVCDEGYGTEVLIE